MLFRSQEVAGGFGDFFGGLAGGHVYSVYMKCVEVKRGVWVFFILSMEIVGGGRAIWEYYSEIIPIVSSHVSIN